VDSEGIAAPPPIAAVLDTSYYDGGHFNWAKIQQLARALALRGAELWIPRQVILEWAVHARGTLTDLLQARKRLLKAGVVDLPEVQRRESSEIAEDLTHLCESTPNVVVLDMSGDAAIAGIRDQILGLGAGKGKPGLRTGASDSSWVRDALTKAADEPRRIVFISKNAKDILATTTQIGHKNDVVQIWSRGDDEGLFKRYFPPPPPSPPSPISPLDALRIITTTLENDFQTGDNDRHGPPPEWIDVPDVAIGDAPEDRRETADLIDPYAEMEPLAILIDVRDVTVDRDGSNVAVSYTVRLLADVRVEGRAINSDGDTIHDWHMQRDRLLAVPFVAKLVDGSLHEAYQNDTADNYPAIERFSDSYDAAAWLYHEELTEWRHITVQVDPEAAEIAGAPQHFELHGPYGQTETAEITVDDSEWTMEFERTGVSIHAFEDPESRVWLGKEEGSYDLRPPVTLRSKLPGFQRFNPEPYTALSVVWAFLMHQQDPDSH
jgi:hypothetical protein